MDSKLYRTHVIIHSYTVAHGLAAAALAQSIVGDEVALTYLSTRMIQSISYLYNQPINKAIGLSALGHVAGFYIGTRLATSLVKWVPALGNAANAISTIKWIKPR